MQILRNLQAEEDKNFEESQKSQSDNDFKIDPLPFDFSYDDDELPF